MKGELGFFDKPGNVRFLKRLFYAALAVIAALDFVIHRHSYFAWEGIPGFFVFYGFLSCVAVVAVSKVLGKLWLKREEGYYDD